MKVSDYIVEFLIRKGITDVFGYPGGMVTHLMDSFGKYSSEIHAHTTYHEQGAAFAACGYAQVTGKPGVAYATSGPGATNLITGICNAYFDSVPAIFLTGQVNVYESKSGYQVRQRGFQETDIVSMVRPVVKYAAYVSSPEEISDQLETAYQQAMSGRRGPVLLDIPMNVMRAELQLVPPAPITVGERKNVSAQCLAQVQQAVQASKRPCFLIGNGVKTAGAWDRVCALLQKAGIPVLTSMIAFDIPCGELGMGFIGAYGMRAANFAAAKCDLIVSLGSRLDVRQVGAKRADFAPGAKIIRFDVDSGELSYPVHEDEMQLLMDMEESLDLLEQVDFGEPRRDWLRVCSQLRSRLAGADDRLPNRVVQRISRYAPENAAITTDVGQNQVWVAQSFQVKPGQRVLFSGGHGAMGYSLPAAIGACHGIGEKTTVCITGDGGIQMNIQELQYIAREGLPIKILVLNNNALGMIRHFQEMYFDSRYVQTIPPQGYTVPCFAEVARAYGIPAVQLQAQDEAQLAQWMKREGPALIELILDEDTYVYPKLEFGKPNQDQEPLLDRPLYEALMALV